MAKAVVTIKVMPESPDIDLAELEKKIKEKITDFAGEGEIKTDIQPVAFGLKSLTLIFVMEESIGSTEPLEKEVESVEGVSSQEITDVRRAVG